MANDPRLMGSALDHQSERYPARFQGRVPKRVRMLTTVHGEPLWLCPVWAYEGEVYDVHTNCHGAVSAFVDDGKRLGLKPDEFEVAEWF